MQNKTKKILLEVIGWFFIIIGIPSLVVPFLQGILFIVIGLYILSFRFPGLENIFKRFFKKFPGVGERAINFHNRLKNKIGI